MIIYIIVFVCTLSVVFLYDETLPDAKRNNFPFLVVALCAIVCGLRDMLGGYDAYIYGEIFEIMAGSTHSWATWLHTMNNSVFHSEFGYLLWNTLIGIVTNNRYIFFFITSCVTYLMFYRHIRKYSPYPNLTFFLFFCFYYFFTFTYLRQVIALSIAWYSIQYAIDRKPIQFLLIVLLAYTFHNSALIFLPVYIVAHREITPSTMAVFLAVALILGFTPLGNILFSIVGDLANIDKAKDTGSSSQSAARIEYVMEAVTFFAIVTFAYSSIPKDRKTTCMLNISYLFMSLLVFFVRFPNGGRLSWYFLIGIVCTFSTVYHTNRDKGIFCPTIIIMFAWLYFRILFGWGDLLTPYTTFLTNGVKNKYMSRRFEYDHRYDKNKLYKW